MEGEGDPPGNNEYGQRGLRYIEATAGDCGRRPGDGGHARDASRSGRLERFIDGGLNRVR